VPWKQDGRLADEWNSSYDVTLAFCKRAAIAQQLVRPHILNFPKICIKVSRSIASQRYSSIKLSNVQRKSMPTSPKTRNQWVHFMVSP
jgi:hypothetical protein